LVARYPSLFSVTENDRTYTPGWPAVGDGWRELVETAVGRIADAIAAAPDSLRVTQIKEKFASIRIYWWPGPGFTDAMRDRVEEAVDLAEARSACTCEQCGAEGRLFKHGGWYLTACDEHAKGEPVAIKPGFENLHIQRSLEAWLPIVSCRRYDRDSDTFIDVDPATIDLDEEN
jgi:hypothetical protein